MGIKLLVDVPVAIGDKYSDNFGLVELVVGRDALRDKHYEIDFNNVDLIYALCLCDLDYLRFFVAGLVPNHERHALPYHSGEVAFVYLDQEHIFYLLIIPDLFHQ
jgi:hypothetical protein